MPLQRYEYDPRRAHRASIRVQKASRHPAKVDDIRIDLGEIDRLIAREFNMHMEEVRIIRLDDAARWRDMQLEAARRRALAQPLRVPMSAKERTTAKEYFLCLVMVPSLVGAFALWLIVHTLLAGLAAIGLLVVAGLCLKRLWRTK